MCTDIKVIWMRRSQGGSYLLNVSYELDCQSWETFSSHDTHVAFKTPRPAIQTDSVWHSPPHLANRSPCLSGPTQIFSLSLGGRNNMWRGRMPGHIIDYIKYASLIYYRLRLGTSDSAHGAIFHNHKEHLIIPYHTALCSLWRPPVWLRY